MITHAEEGRVSRGSVIQSNIPGTGPNGTSVIMEIRHLRVPPFKVTQGHRNWQGSIGLCSTLVLTELPASASLAGGQGVCCRSKPPLQEPYTLWTFGLDFRPFGVRASFGSPLNSLHPQCLGVWIKHWRDTVPVHAALREVCRLFYKSIRD